MRKRVLKNCHIYTMLAHSARKRHLSFHTPGHKKGKWDLTELSYTDNLSAPNGCIREAEEDIARILGAEKSFILTDGSTCGVLSMLYAAKKLGVKKIALSQASHKSVFHGCALLGLTPLVFTGERERAPSLPDLKEGLLEGLCAADALLLTSPTYYGSIPDLAAFRRYCDETGKLLLIDGAHGGHLHFEDFYAGRYADIWVDGVHKSLPALTQGGVVSAKAGGVDALREGVDIFRTTSPSYPIMASVEYAVKYPRNLLLEGEVRAFAKSCPRANLREDWTKLCILFGENAFSAHKALQERGIYPEFCDGNVVEFYLSPATSLRRFKRLKRVLKKILAQYPYAPKKELQPNPAPLLCVENAETEWVEIERAAGRICAAECGLFPPCVPLLTAGEKITEEKIALLKAADNLYGVVDKKILAVKDATR